MSYDWSQFSVHTYCNRPVNDVFRMWATSGGLEQFFIKSAKHTSSDGKVRNPGDLAQAEDEYLWQFKHAFQLPGKIIEVTDTPSISFTFGTMKVKVEVQGSEGKSLVRLHQSGIPFATEEDKSSSHLNCRSCWVFFMTNLKSIMEHGHDLREPDATRSDCVSVHFAPPELTA